MVDTKQFNPLPLLSVKAGLDSSMAQISSELELYFAEGWAGNQHLRLAQDELHRAVGVLQMLSLEGLAVFSRELETVLQEMLAQLQAPTTMHRDTLRGAMLALSQYLDALADGASNTALRLFYSYQELHQLRGLESAFEVDLFFPEFGVELPAEVLDVPLVPAALASVKKARAQYQRALLKWLRQDNPAQSLRTMRATVQAVMACAPQDQQRAFWWIATGLLDCLIHDGLPAELNANKLLARIDLQMKSMVENKQRDTEYNTTCGMQYMLARSQPVSETVDKIKQTYELKTYLPETQPLSHGEAVQVLGQMHALLLEAQEVLEQCVKGDDECGKRYTEKLEHLCNLSEGLDRDTLQFLCKQGGRCGCWGARHEPGYSAEPAPGAGGAGAHQRWGRGVCGDLGDCRLAVGRGRAGQRAGCGGSGSDLRFGPAADHGSGGEGWFGLAPACGAKVSGWHPVVPDFGGDGAGCGWVVSDVLCP